MACSRRLDHHPDRLTEDLLAVHVEEAAVVTLEEVAERAVGTEVPREQLAGAVDRFEHDRTGTVTDQDGDRSVVPVGDAAQGLRPDHQEPLGPDGQHAVGHHQRVDEARAGRVDVEGPPGTPIPSCTVAEVPGTIWSGVVVARITPSISSGRRPALCRARPARPRWPGPKSCPPIRRSRMPVRSRIQSVAGVQRRRQVLVGDDLVGDGDAPAGDHPSTRGRHGSARLEDVDADEAGVGRRSIEPDHATRVGRHRQSGAVDLPRTGVTRSAGPPARRPGRCRWHPAGVPGPPDRHWG